MPRANPSPSPSPSPSPNPNPNPNLSPDLTEAGREEKGLQFDLEKEAWRFTFERAKPNAMRLRIEVYPKSSATASQVLFAFPDPKGSN